MHPFTDKVIIITGASEGIGRALAMKLAPQKPKLIISARNVARLEELRRDAEAQGAQCFVVAADISNQRDCQKIIGETVSRFSRIDVLVNNAGITMWTPCVEITDTSIFERVMRTNYLSAAYCTYYALPHLIKTKGLIVAVSSVAGLTGVPTRTAYAASKHAMFGFFNSLRIELIGTGVDITMVAPDFVLSEIHRRALGADGTSLGKSPMQEGKIMTAAQCADKIVKAMAKRKRLLLTSLRGKVGYPLSILAPSLTDAVALKAIKDRK